VITSKSILLCLMTLIGVKCEKWALLRRLLNLRLAEAERDCPTLDIGAVAGNIRHFKEQLDHLDMTSLHELRWQLKAMCPVEPQL
jgi:hypothetical protein